MEKFELYKDVSSGEEVSQETIDSAGGDSRDESLEVLNEKEFKEKHPFFYHGTVNGSIEEFTPRSAENRPTEEPAVYASPDMDIAMQSMANALVSNGGIVNGRKFVCIPMTKEEFSAQDRGGVVYALASDSFKMNHGKGFGGEKEWVSLEPVKPKDKIVVPSLFNALNERGVEVYFIQPEMIPVINEAQDGDPEQLELLLDDLKASGDRLYL